MTVNLAWEQKLSKQFYMKIALLSDTVILPLIRDFPLPFDHQRSFNSPVSSLRLRNSLKGLLFVWSCGSPPIRGSNQRGTRSCSLFCCFLSHSLAAHTFMHVAHTLTLSCSGSHSNRTGNVCVLAAGCAGRAARGTQLGDLILSRCYQEGLLLYKEPM